MASDNSKTCYIATDASTSSTWSSSLLHDLLLVIITIITTCLATAAYNYYLHYQVNKSIQRKKEHEAAKKITKAARSLIFKKSLPGGLELHGGGSGAKSRFKKIKNVISATNSFASTLAHVEGTQASGNFISAVLSQMWNHMNIAVSNTIKDTLEPTLKELKPVPLHFVRLDLGDVPIRTTNMFIHRCVDLDKNKEGYQAGIQVDVDVIWVRFYTYIYIYEGGRAENCCVFANSCSGPSSVV